MLTSLSRRRKFWKGWGRSRELEILERSELESVILPPTPQHWWQLHHLGFSDLAWILDYDLWKNLSLLALYICAAHTSLIKVLNTCFLHWVLSIFKYFRSISGLFVHIIGDLNQKISYTQQLAFSQLRLLVLYSVSSVRARAALCSWVGIFLNIIYIRLNGFWSNGLP